MEIEMNKKRMTGAARLVYALEQIGVRETFGIPGVHNTEIYDELSQSTLIQPILVTHEAGAAFMADAISRTTSRIGTLVIVPAAGLTHAMSGVGEAFLDGIPMLIISGGTRRDTGRSYQIHQLDQIRLVSPLVKKAVLVTEAEQIVPTIYELFALAMTGRPGPVFVEIPAELQLFESQVESLPRFQGLPPAKAPDLERVRTAAQMLLRSQRPGIYLGWGARNATEFSVKIAEILQAPVATTMQGLSVFPGNHPLRAGMGFGNSAVPGAQTAFEDCDCLLTVGASFGELATGSYGIVVPKDHIHIDIDPEVFNKNFGASLTIEADGELALQALLESLRVESLGWKRPEGADVRIQKMAREKKTYLESWTTVEQTEQVSPGIFFRELRAILPRDGILVLDDGNHTFLAAELFEPGEPKTVLSPTDFNCMGYAVPAAIGAKIAHPERAVFAVVGDGAFQMTGFEMLTAKTQGLGIAFFVFSDGELGQIAHLQQIPLNRKTCTILGQPNLEGFAQTVGAKFISLEKDADVREALRKASLWVSQGQSVLVDVKIDYRRKTQFTQGAVKTNLKRFPMREKLRFIARAAKRHVFS